MDENSDSIEYVWFDNKIVEIKDANISATSPSARYGISAFEGIRAYLSSSGSKLTVFRLDCHLDRLLASALKLNLPIRESKSDIKKSIFETLIKNGCIDDTYIRVDALSAGSGSWSTEDPSTIVITVKKSKQPEKFEERKITAHISSFRRIDALQIPPTVKAGANYINSRYAYLEAKALGYNQPILLNLQGNVSEGAGACLMAVINEILVTPPVSAQILESITRDSILSLAEESRIQTSIQNLTPEDLLKASEVFLCGTSVEVLPIESINKLKIGTQPTFPIANFLFDRYMDAVRDHESKGHPSWNLDHLSLREI